MDLTPDLQIIKTLSFLEIFLSIKSLTKFSFFCLSGPSKREINNVLEFKDSASGFPTLFHSSSVLTSRTILFELLFKKSLYGDRSRAIT